MSKSRAGKTKAAGVAVGLTVYGRQFGSGKCSPVPEYAHNRALRRMLKGSYQKEKRNEGNHEISR